MLPTNCIYDQINKIAIIQEKIIQFLDDEDIDQNELFDLLGDYKIYSNKYEFIELLHMISKISKYHHRIPGFLNKIEIIIKKYQNEIQNFFSNIEIFNIFKSCKRILLFLFEEKIIKPEEYIFLIISNQKFTKRNYPQYFSIEFGTDIPNLEDDIELFKQKRRIGENDSYICTLIQKDQVEDFIAYVNRNNIPLDSQINNSIYETNTFLFHKNPTLIEYAAFFGSIQIFQYLFMNNVNLNLSIWFYAIYGKNPIIIHFLEENDFLIDKKSVQSSNSNFVDLILNESIKCHHIEITNYIVHNFKISDSSKFSISQSIKYFNYIDICSKNIDDLINNHENIFELIKYDYIQLINIMLSKMPNKIINKKYKIRTNDPEKDMHFKIRQISAFHAAIENKKMEIIKLLLANQSIDVNDQLIEEEHHEKKIYHSLSRTEKTPLFIALEIGDKEIFNLLYSHPKINIHTKLIYIDYETVTRYEKSLILFVFEKGYVDILKLLVKNSCIDINSPFKGSNDIEKFEKPLLYMAVESGNIDIINLLLTRPDLNIDAKYTKFYFGKCINGEVFDKNKPVHTDKTILHVAIEKQNIDIIKLILSMPNIDINAKCIEYESGSIVKTALHIAIEKENIDIIKLLLSKPNINVNAKCINYGIRGFEKSALHIAIEKENIDIIKLLLSKPNIDINTKYIKHGIRGFEKSALHLAIENRNNDIIKLLLSKADLDINAKYIEYYNEELNLDIHISNYYEQTAIHMITEKENLDLLKILLSRSDLDINAKCIINNHINKCQNYYNEKTAIHIAIQTEKTEIIKCFLSRFDLDLNAKYINNRYIRLKHRFNYFKKTAFHMIIENNYHEIIKSIITSKFYIDVNIKSVEKRNNYIILEKTALTLSIEKNNIYLLKFLLNVKDLNVNQFVKNNTVYNNESSCYMKKSITALHLAVENHNIEAVKLLLKHNNINCFLKSNEFDGVKTDHRTPYNIAESNNDDEIISIFLRK